MKALAIAATGMNAQSTNVDVIANNIANINTTGFKRSRAEFTDLLYETQRLAGVSNRGNQGVVPEGAQLVAADVDLDPLTVRYPVPMLGHVTSSYRSAVLERTFALALIKGGRDRIGETVLAPLGDRTIAATITAPVFYDQEGARRDG